MGFDTSPIIHFIESNPKYDESLLEIFERIDLKQMTGVTSTITLCEVLVHPLSGNNFTLYSQYCDLLLGNDSFTTVSITPGVAQQAAGIRARYGFRTPDALQVAVAIQAGCQAFLTGDRRLSRVTEIRVILLDEIG